MALRVGIVTFHQVTNFGAVLQAYALRRVLEEFGCEAKVVDYRPGYLVKPHQRLGRRPSAILNNVIRLWRFNRFRRKFIATTDRVYRNEHELRSHPPDVDVYVCGSDQVWNMRIMRGRFDAGFFLSFVSDGTRRIAYAPSFGDTLAFDSQRDEAARLLRRFHALSAREEPGRALIRQLTGREAPLVLDPSLLVEDYSAVIRRPKGAPNRYILAYPMEYSEQFTVFVRRVRQLLRLPVVNVGIMLLPGADLNHIRLGPGEWLGWIQGASFVCTNSFHGTTYSIIFRRDFASFPHQHVPTLSTRIQNLLEQIGLGERFVADTTGLDGGSPCLQPVNYAAAGPLLQAAVSKSRGYLRDAVFAEYDRAPRA